MSNHQPVCLNASIQGLNISADGVFIDATFGRGGHSRAILEKLGNNGKLFAYDRDPAAKKTALEKFSSDQRFVFIHSPFSKIPQDMEKEGLAGKVHGILLDLGVSSPQLDDPKRGFSFMHNGPLDMRMDPRHGRPAADWLTDISEQKLCEVIRKYGEERFARRIAKAICSARSVKTIETTGELVDIITAAVPGYERGKHPATRTFQAIRIAVNGELEELEQLLDKLLDVVKIGGRIVILSYHSLEHVLVKDFLKKYGPGHENIQDKPIAQTPKLTRLKRIGRPIKAEPEEVKLNRRARSAYLRILEKQQ